jgi:hypothetical protein
MIRTVVAIHESVYVYIYVFVYVHMYIYAHTYIHTHTNTYTHMLLSDIYCIHGQHRYTTNIRHAYMHGSARAHTHTHTHVHVCRLQRLCTISKTMMTESSM